MSAAPAAKRVVALAIPAVVAFDLSIPAQIFGHRSARSRYSFAICSSKPGLVPSSTGFDVVAPLGLEALAQADTVIVPGFDPLDGADDASLDALRAAADRGARIASVCVGAFALAAAGLLDGRTATTHWEEADHFRQRFPGVRLNPDVLYVDDGAVLTSAGLSAGIDLCVYLVRKDYGEQAATDVARRMVIATHRTGGQLQYAQRPVPIDGGLGATREWAIAEMHRPLTVARLARHAGLPVRSFTRQFREEVEMTPMRWLALQRVREALRLLEATDLDVDDIAERSGFGSAATLRAHLAREVGVTPTAYRRRQRSRLAEVGQGSTSSGRDGHRPGGDSAAISST